MALACAVGAERRAGGAYKFQSKPSRQRLAEEKPLIGCSGPSLSSLLRARTSDSAPVMYMQHNVICGTRRLTVGADMHDYHFGVVLPLGRHLSMLDPPEQLLHSIACRDSRDISTGSTVQSSCACHTNCQCEQLLPRVLHAKRGCRCGMRKGCAS